MKMRLLNIVRPHGLLVLIKRSAPYRSQLTWVWLVFILGLIVLEGYILAMRSRPNYWIFGFVLVILLLILAARAFDLRRMAQKDEVFCFDREGDRVLKNGEPIAHVSEVDHVLIRRILQNPEDERRAEYALVVNLEDTRHIPIAESMGIPGGKQEIEEAARQLATYLEVEVKQADRMDSEWWMDK